MELFFLALLVILMAAALGSGFPVAFALPGSAIVTIGLAAMSGMLFEGNADAYFAQGSPVNWLSAGVTNFRGIYWEVERDTLIAIPLFVFMGIMLQRSKIAEDLLVSMAQLFGPIRGGLGISVVFVGALLAATTGIVGATVVAMGLISLPAMLRNNYSHPLATGTIAASGTLGQIIPPSIVLIILADQLSGAVDQAATARLALYKANTGEFSMPSEFSVSSTSAGDMFMGALLPGLILVGLYMLFILVISFVRPKMAPAVHFDGAYDRRFAGKVLLALVPPLTLIFVVLGSIITGIATVNQAGAIGAAGALIMAGYRLYEGKGTYRPAVLAVVSVVLILGTLHVVPLNIRQVNTQADVIGMLVATVGVIGLLVALSWSGYRTLKIDNTLQGVMIETAKTTSLVFIILLGAAMLTAAFRAFGGEDLVREFLTGLPGGFWAQFIIVMAVIFVLGFFLDFIEIAVVVVPIVAPILLMDPSANVTAVWLGVMIGLNIQTSFLTPPFGFALFYLRGVAPAVVRTISMYKGVVPFISLQLFALFIVGVVPELVNYIPSRVSLTGVTAPPPKNPRLQSCIEDYIRETNANRGDEIKAAIRQAQGWDLSTLPKRRATAVAKALDTAGQTFTALDEAFAASKAIDDAAVNYRPLHVAVRATQDDIRGHKQEIQEIRNRIDLAKRFRPDETAYLAGLEEERDRLEAELKQLEASIPDDWEPRHRDFKKVLAEEKRARLTYRRTTDQAYEPILELIGVLRTADALAALEDDLRALGEVVRSEQSADSKEEAIKEVERQLNDGVSDVNEIRTALSSTRRAIRRDADKPEKAIQEFEKAVAIMSEEITWRTNARESLLPQLEAYDAAIKYTIGLRQLNRMPDEIAVEIAACQAHHTDISLYF
ncbi:MAG: TRAP transporter large permease subunit [Thalassobaculum sp.]|uniref:TRAP transporter large permease subunit n=1 Tax=Thalassobaculum sp. TaxID=2022740 RepID=UPI0032EE94D0